MNYFRAVFCCTYNKRKLDDDYVTTIDGLFLNKPEKSFSPEARDTVTSHKDQQGITERSM